MSRGPIGIPPATPATRWMFPVVCLAVPSLLASGCFENTEQLADVYPMCALELACAKGQIAYGMNHCDTYELMQRILLEEQRTDAREYAASLPCKLQAQTCEAIDACTQGTAAQQARCAADDVLSFCDGQWLLDCPLDAGAPPRIVDCGAVGLRCFEREGVATCGIEACDPESYAVRCDEELIVACETGGGAVILSDCRRDRFPHEATCEVSASGIVHCEPTGASCDPEPSYCDGTVITGCPDGYHVRQDCAVLVEDGTCVEDDGPISQGWAHCEEPEPACIGASDQRCDDGVIYFCANGESRRFDCHAAGYSGCATRTQQHDFLGGGLQTVAYCVF